MRYEFSNIVDENVSAPTSGEDTWHSVATLHMHLPSTQQQFPPVGI